MGVFDNETVVDGGGPGQDYSSAAVGYQPSTRQGSEVALAVRRLFGDMDGVQLDDTDLIGWINDAQDEIVNINRVMKAKGRTDSISGTRTYVFPNKSIQQIESLHYGGVLLPNVPYAEAEAQGYIGDTATGTPTVWWEWGGRFSLYPTPSVSARIDMRYTIRPDPLVNLTDLLGVPDKYYQAVILYVMQQAYELDERFDAVQLKAGQFRTALQDFDEEERTAQNMTYETITVYPDSY